MQQCGAGVLGYIVVQVNSITAHVNKLAVAPEARRMGLATHLLQVLPAGCLNEAFMCC